MAYLTQCLIIAAVTASGEALRLLIPLPIPAGIYSILLMLALLAAGIVKLKQVEAVGDTLVRLIPLLLVPAVTGVMGIGGLGSLLIPCLIAVCLLTAAVMAAAGGAAQAVISRKKKG
jgi:holin-like protein